MRRPINRRYHAGGVSILVLIVGLMGGLVMGAMITLVGSDYMSSTRATTYEQALSLAEAGVNYYRWHLSHDPQDYQDGTGQPGPYVHDFKDPQGDVVGTFELSITPPDPGSTVVTIESVGRTIDNPEISRKVKVKYGIPSIARYSFLHNADVWFGQGLTVHGRVLSNGGIRQDGINNSIIQSAKETYTCNYDTGCNPPQTKNGVWGNGGDQELWDFPAPPMDFDGFSVDFAEMRAAAQASGSYYGSSGNPGYHFVFKSTGQVDVYRVTRTRYYYGYNDGSCSRLYQRIRNENLVNTFDLSTTKVFFVEDTVWVEGTVRGEATVVAARFPILSYQEDMWIKDSVTYTAKDGSDSLGLIAQGNIYFAKDVPNDFEIDAALLAQQGRILRHYYGYWCGNYSNAVRNHLEIYGSVISNQKSYWNWGTGSSLSSGFSTRDVVYDGSMYLEPPPYFPTSGDYEIISWEEE